MNNAYARNVSRNDRLWIAADQVTHADQAPLPCVSHGVIEGNGDLDEKRLAEAVEIASAANPGSRLILKGHLRFGRWVDSGVTPPFKVVDGSQWTGMGPDNAPFLLGDLPAVSGPTCEVLLIKGRPTRFAVRTHHAVMDVRGMMTWMEDIFRVMRGERPLGSSFPLNDREFILGFNKGSKEPTASRSIAPTGAAKGTDVGTLWGRRTIKGKIPNLLGKVIVLTAQHARTHADGSVIFDVPVDIRSRHEGLRATGNFAPPLKVSVAANSTPDQIAEDIATQLKEFNDLKIEKNGFLLDFLPLGLMSAALKKVMSSQHKSGRYSVSGIISNTGRLPLDKFSGGGFSATSGFFIPSSTELFPLYLAITGGADCIEIIISMPRRLAGQGRMDALFDAIAYGLQNESTVAREA